MARNVEIKARASNFERQARLAEDLETGGMVHLVQEDTFFQVPTGRLKLREFGDGSAELIQYEREDSVAPMESRYVCAPADKPEMLKEALSMALGVRAVVRKERTVFLVGRTRVHLDRVEGLGDFLELEVVLRPGEDPAHGVDVAERLMSQLEIEREDLVEPAYVDLLEEEEWSAEPPEVHYS